MSPRLEDIESTIDRSLRSEFYAPGEREVEFDMSEVLRGDYETRVDKALAARQAGLVTGNEGRAIIGESLSEDPEMNKIYANAALVPLGSKAEAVVPESAPAFEAASSASPKALTVRSIMGRLARIKADKPAVREQLVKEHTDALVKFFTAQQDATLAKAGQKDAGVFDPSAWDSDLAELLQTLGDATSKAVGDATGADLGGKYNPDDIADWIASDAQQSATSINQATADQIDAALGDDHDVDALKAFFVALLAGRAIQIATSRVATVGGLASQVAARQNKARTKTWETNSANARPSHEAMSGETVPLNQPFSNGMNGPGDPSGGADEVA